MGTDQLLSPAPATATEEVVAGRLAIYCEACGRVYELDADRSVVWALCEDRDLSAVVDEFARLKSDVAAQRAREYVEATVAEFVANGLLQVAGVAEPCPSRPEVRLRPGGG